MKLLFLILISSSLYASDKKTFEEKQSEIIDYSNIKKVLEKDGLVKEAEKKKKIVEEIKKQKSKINTKKYDYPTKDDFWKIVSEYWLVKNAQLLSWDFPKPDYGIETAFRNLLTKFGYFNVDFKILVVNTPLISHFGLPSAKGEYIFLLSLPFMQSLDLTKVDLSLLLLEDFFRLKQNLFIDNLKFDKTLIGGNFEEKGFSKDLFTPVLKQYSEQVLKTGFNFEQQFLITKEMDSILKSEPALWGAYYRLYNKIDRFVKTDALFKNYLSIYPSPEFQLKWLSPKKKVI